MLTKKQLSITTIPNIRVWCQTGVKPIDLITKQFCWNGDRVNLSAEETDRTTFLRSDWPRPFARREVGVEMELGRSENKRPEQRRS
ncbi:hypothetical protein TNCV_4046051 [Trichonephila clavipes]|nr:hypothetical protein TNCV_4046051 [Trichonephila clavipes]